MKIVNQHRIAFLNFLILFCSTGAASAELVAHWPLNEGSGDTFTDVVGGFNGFLPEANFGDQTEVEWGEGPPTQDHAVEFLGENSFIATPFPGIEADNPRTVTFWFKTELDDSAYFLAWGANAESEKWHIRLNGADGMMRTEFQGGQNFATTNLIDGEWHHVASVFPEGASEGEEILHYVDGELDPQTGGTSLPIDTAIGTGDTDWLVADSLEPYDVHFGGVLAHGFNRMLEGSMADIRIYDEGLSQERIQAIMDGSDPGGVGGLAPRLQAGDADMDLDFDQLDLVRVQIAAKYLTGEAATWGDGDWNGAPGGEVGSPPDGDGSFNQLDIVSALSAGVYLTGPYAAIAAGGISGDGQTSLVYDVSNGELSVDAPAGQELTSINITSAGGKFLGDKPPVLDGAFDNFAADNVFKATFGGSFGSISFGTVLPSGLTEVEVSSDLSAVGSLAGGGDLGDVDLIYIPEPAGCLLLLIGVATMFCRRFSKFRAEL